MRKIKITALLLAVLMIVTAFAGCASKSTVTNLDNKVNDLDASIEEQKAALSGIESTLATISKALENQGSSENLDEVIKDIEENEKATADLAGAIKDLQSAIEDLKKEPATQAPATPDDLQVVINQYSAKLEALAGEVEDDKDNYTAATLTAIRELVGEVETSIENAKDKAAVEAAYKAFTDKLADKTYMSVNGKLYAYVVELKGNITDASADKVEEAVDALADAIEFYTAAGLSLDAINDYEINDDETIDLEAAINELEDDQTVKLPVLKADAAVLGERIADIDATYTFADVTNLLSDYKLWEKRAKELSPENVKLVKNYADLLAAHTSALNSDTAKIIFKAGKVESVRFGTDFGKDVGVFDDYIALLGGDQVLFVFDTVKKNADGSVEAVKALTTSIYATIDAWVADWAKEYGLTDLAVETIIDSEYGKNFYAKYNADKALVAAFEAESKTLAEGIFKNIKALNNKRLGADAVEVLNSYKKNAADINAWRDALVDAYEADLRADDDELETRNIYNIALYEAALVENFNAMVEQAELCVYHAKTSTNPVAYYEAYGLGFIEKLDDDTNDNAYYHKLYDFKNAEMVTFLRVTFQEAQNAADKINKRIESFKTAQAHSVASIIANIGGYVEVVGDKLLAVKDTAIVAGAAGVPDTIAEFIYKYKTDVKYDLSSMIDVAAYEAKIAEVEKNIKAADAALEALDAAYGKYLKGDGLVTLGDKAEITALKNLLTKWMAVGHVDMVIATEDKTAANGVKEYKLTKLTDRYDNITPAVLVTDDVYTNEDATGAILLAEHRVNLLQKQANLAISAYEMMDKLYDFNKTVAFSFDNYSSETPLASAYANTRNNFGTHGIVSVTCGDMMTADGTDAKGRTYKQGMSLWTIEYVTYVEKDSGATPLFETKKEEGYFYSNYTDAVAAANYLADAKNTAGKTVQEVMTAKLYGSKPTDVGNYVTTLFTNIPALVSGNNMSGLTGKLIANAYLPMLATSLEARFLVNNYGEVYEALDKANDKFDAENGGYGYQYVKGLSYAYVDSFDTVTKANKAAVKSATDIESLRIAVKACLVDVSGVTPEVVFGGADRTWMLPVLDLEAMTAHRAPVAPTDPKPISYLNDFDLDTDDFNIDVLLIYRACDHATLVAGVCGTVKCPICAESFTGALGHTAPAGADTCKGYECTKCGETVAPEHMIKVEVTKLWIDTVNFEIGKAEYTYSCTNIAGACTFSGNGEFDAKTFFNDADNTKSLTANDTLTFTLEIANAKKVSVVATFDGAAWNTVTTVA